MGFRKTQGFSEKAQSDGFLTFIGFWVLLVFVVLLFEQAMLE